MLFTIFTLMTPKRIMYMLLAIGTIALAGYIYKQGMNNVLKDLYKNAYQSEQMRTKTDLELGATPDDELSSMLERWYRD